MAALSQRTLSRAAAGVAVPLASIAVLAFAGCGGGGGSSSSSTSSQADGSGSLSVTVEPAQAGPGTTVKATVVNDTDAQYTYGAGYELERQVGDIFEQVKLPKKPVISIGYVADPGKSGPPVRVEIPGSAKPGTYRVVIQRDVPDVGDLSGEFEVVPDS